MATQRIMSPLDHADPYAKEHREQLIGAAPSYLYFQTTANDLQQELIEAIKKQDNE